MPLPKKLSRLAVGTIDSALNVVQLVIWVPIGLLLFVGIAGVVFAPVLAHLQAYWWMYLLATSALIAVIVYLTFRGASHVNDLAHTSSQPPYSQVMPSTPQKQSAGPRPKSGPAPFRFGPAHTGSQPTYSQVEPRTPQEHSAGTRPTSGLALFRFTEEWITRNGLHEGREMSKGDAVKTAGRTAVSHHLREGNFVEREGKISLTAKGELHFAKRRSRL